MPLYSLHSNRLNPELYSEPSFPAPQLYLLSHTLKGKWKVQVISLYSVLEIVS